MAQDAIILYENGKAIGGEGHPTDAGDITFDNTGTDLVSEEVESAIKEVNAKTKHGIVELWKNNSPTSAFAGQTVNITTDYTLDSVMIEQNGGLLAMGEVGGGGFISDIFLGGTSKITFRYREYNISRSGSTLSIAFTDCTQSVQNSIGSAPTTSTTNERCIPIRILGLIHNN